jgi:hypothetical protein
LLSARREALVVGAGAMVVAAAMKAPAVRGIGRTIPKDLVDPLYQTWQLAWGAHALRSQPLSPWDSNAFWPLRRSLAFSDSLYGYSPFGLLFGSGTTASLVRYTVLFILAYALAATGAYLLARQLGCPRVGAAVAGAAYAYAPWHLAHDGHLNVLSNGALPLSLALLARGHGVGARGGGGPTRPWCALAGWAVAAWQLTVTFVVGLQLAYALGALTLGVAALAFIKRWRPVNGGDRRLLAADLIGVALFAGVGLALALPYLEVTRSHPQAVRTMADVRLFSPPLRGFFVAPAESTIWGGIDAGVRRQLAFPGEMAHDVGVVVVLLAAYGVVKGRWSVARRVGLAVATGLVLLLGAGTTVADGRLYRILYEYAPGWRSVRTPGRLVILATLMLALLAGTGTEALCRTPRTRRLLGVVLVGLVLVDGHGSLPTPRVPAPSPGVAAAADPVLVLPTDDVLDMQAIWASTEGLPRIVNGATGFTPKLQGEVRQRTVGFPDAASIEFLRRLGVRTVVLRPALASGTPWAGAERRPVEALGVTVRPLGGDLVYDLMEGH